MSLWDWERADAEPIGLEDDDAAGREVVLDRLEVRKQKGRLLLGAALVPRRKSTTDGCRSWRRASNGSPLVHASS